ncbi:protease modulator HflK [Rahnella aceris]|jgi:regulator of protease activity HflC (stomatin/prohibitin superfamily)|uniref:protease modulator HflK n=1 Tax=Rahnella sp. (strain Y9602) TaxID=2703885 RepID=UPI001421E437|nr:protease modulator HflK [Rahnella aceris]NIA87893.1 protease modulator HflK [Rahnella aceris]
MNPLSRFQGNAWFQAGRIACLALFAMTLIAAANWLFSNVRQIEPDKRAVVMRFGAVSRTAGAGLLLAWPEPLEQVEILPAADRVIEHHVTALLRENIVPAWTNTGGEKSDAVAGAGYLLTGDSGVVQLDVQVYYVITDPVAFVLQGEHVLPALDRLTEHAAVAICASRDLDTILVARPEMVGNDSHIAERRERLRGDLRQGINQQLAALRAAGSNSGIEVRRVDVQSSLPPSAVEAFNAVLTASQQADQNIASASNEAASAHQEAVQAADRTLQVSHAKASEQIAQASTETATVVQLANDHSPELLWRLWRERMPAILAHAGGVTAVDPHDDAHLILPGPDRPSSQP